MLPMSQYDARAKHINLLDVTSQFYNKGLISETSLLIELCVPDRTCR